MKFSTKIKKLAADNTIAVIIASAISIFTAGYSVSSVLNENKYESKIQDYQTIIASINRRAGGNKIIDISRLKIHKDSTNFKKTGLNKFFANDNFYATNDNYWLHKLTNPIEISYIKNGKIAPAELRDNPVDMPIHAWISKEEFKITQANWQRKVEPYSLWSEVDREKLSKDKPEPIIYPTDQIIFNPTIILHRWQRNKNHFAVKDSLLDSTEQKVGFEELPQNELIGKFLTDDMQKYFYDFPSMDVKREILSVQKNGNTLYTSYLTTYNNIEINNVKQESFFVWREFIVICTDKDIYEIDIQTPSLEPIKNGHAFEKVTEWYNSFGIITD